ncbi:glutamine amidotransferase [Aliiroseovarius sp. YM-037]|uniref:glutamine amidotransferase n=1 Tax=Aliiroseovarius sp. YM-037 TaxID=3341728 RepID=UPI003A8117B8
MVGPVTKPFLILQLRPETEASDDEYAAILRKGGLSAEQTHRIRLDQEPVTDDLDLLDYAGVIVGGGPGCVSDSDSAKSNLDRQIEQGVMGLMPEITARDLPFMGCCYGIGILGHHLGAPVTKERYSEPVGTADCALTDAGRVDPLLAGLPEQFKAFVGHKEAVQDLPEGVDHLIASPTCPYQMIRHGQNVYATQFHPEADAAGFEVRIRIYKDKGYFPPEDADRLIEMCRSVTVDVPEQILANFVARYSGG